MEPFIERFHQLPGTISNSYLISPCFGVLGQALAGKSNPAMLKGYDYQYDVFLGFSYERGGNRYCCRYSFVMARLAGSGFPASLDRLPPPHILAVLTRCSEILNFAW